MTTVTYSKGSIYQTTPQTSWYLDIWTPPSLARDSSDKLIIIDNKFNLRPDLHAYALYGNSIYWWVFCLLNPDIITYPVFDHQTGTSIWVPLKTRVVQ